MIEQRASEARDGEEVVEQRPHWATPLVRGWMIIAAAAVAAAWDVTYQDDGTWRNQCCPKSNNQRYCCRSAMMSRYAPPLTPCGLGSD